MENNYRKMHQFISNCGNSYFENYLKEQCIAIINASKMYYYRHLLANELNEIENILSKNDMLKIFGVNEYLIMNEIYDTFVFHITDNKISFDKFIRWNSEMAKNKQLIKFDKKKSDLSELEKYKNFISRYFYPSIDEYFNDKNNIYKILNLYNLIVEIFINIENKNPKEFIGLEDPEKEDKTIKGEIKKLHNHYTKIKSIKRRYYSSNPKIAYNFEKEAYEAIYNVGFTNRFIAMLEEGYNFEIFINTIWGDLLNSEPFKKSYFVNCYKKQVLEWSNYVNLDFQVQQKEKRYVNELKTFFVRKKTLQKVDDAFMIHKNKQK